MDIQTYLIYTLTTAIVIFSPGPTAILMASQGASNGLKPTLFGVFGITCATMIYYAMSATGIASLIVASYTLFQIIKWVGVAYLLYLGSSAIFSKSGGLVVKSGAPLRKRSSLFTHGFLVEFSNPKALLFFSAILPQFLNVEKPIAQQFFIMWATAFLLQWVIYSGYAYLGHRLVKGGVKSWIINMINKTAGAALIFAGIKMASVSANR
ncbi:MAG TPA: LysE family translocator [Rhodobacteraceae bacterium]|nr:LysE family translocator [Paracoccaceae bacterium]